MAAGRELRLQVTERDPDRLSSRAGQRPAERLPAAMELDETLHRAG